MVDHGDAAARTADQAEPLQDGGGLTHPFPPSAQQQCQLFMGDAYRVRIGTGKDRLQEPDQTLLHSMVLVADGRLAGLRHQRAHVFSVQALHRGVGLCIVLHQLRRQLQHITCAQCQQMVAHAFHVLQPDHAFATDQGNGPARTITEPADPTEHGREGKVDAVAGRGRFAKYSIVLRTFARVSSVISKTPFGDNDGGAVSERNVVACTDGSCTDGVRRLRNVNTDVMTFPVLSSLM